MCRIIADVFERGSGIVDLLAVYPVEVQIAALAAGDYSLPRGALVQRKAVRDLHESIVRGRFWLQLGKLRGRSRSPYLLIEGLDLDAGPLRPNAIRGACLATVAQGIPILRSNSRADSARWIALLALRAHSRRPCRDRPGYAQRLKPSSDRAAEAMLASVPGISVELARRRLLARFGSPNEVFAAGIDRWLDVPGMGKQRAAALERTLASRARRS